MEMWTYACHIFMIFMSCDKIAIDKKSIFNATVYIQKSRLELLPNGFF